MISSERVALEAMRGEWWRGDRLTLNALADAAEDEGCPLVAAAYRQMAESYCPLVEAYREAMAWCLQQGVRRGTWDRFNKKVTLPWGRVIVFRACRYVRTLRGVVTLWVSRPAGRTVFDRSPELVPGVWERNFVTEITPKGELARLRFLGKVYAYKPDSQ
jgi:hypothetical protein